jgi:hypothetical protein
MAETRMLTRAQLDEWGLPHETATDGQPNPYNLAVELDREQIDTRRWYSIHRLVFRAPDDGQPWSVTYMQGLTEIQEGYDEWDEADSVTATRMEQYKRTVTAWREAPDA